MKPFHAAPLVLLLTLLPVWAQQSDGKLSDAERAKRDADKVFSFIKFHTVKPAAPAVAAPKPAAAPAAVSRSLPIAAAAATAAPRAAGAPAAASAAARPETQLAARASEAPAEPAPAPAASAVQASLPAVPAPLPAATQPLAEPVAEPDEEVPLKLIAYVAPDMSAQVMAAMSTPQVVVPVRFTVQPDGRVSSAQAMSNVPRRIANSAVRAVQQWRFEPIPAVREVDVEIAFKAAE